MFRLLLTFCLLSQFANAAGRVYPLNSRTLDPSGINFDFKYKYSQTLNYYDVDGNEVALEEEDDYKLTDYNFSLSYGYTTNLELGINFIYRQVTSSDAFVENSAGGIESYALSAKYSFTPSQSYSLAFSAEYRVHPYDNVVYLNAADVPTDEVILGDSGNSFLARLYFDSIVNKLTTIETSVGYHIPSNDLSHEIPFSAAIVRHYTSFAIWAGARGVFSMGQDEYSTAPEKKVLNANGKTARWNSINRSYQEAFGGIAMLLADKYRLSLEVSNTYSGASTDKMTNVIGGISWTTGGVSRETRMENSFKEYVAEATIVKLSPRGKFVKIDKGLVQDVSKGANVDIYKSDYFGGNELIASGVVYESGPNWAIVKLLKKYKNLPIEKGLTVRIK